ncbi:MAG: FAD-dependent oxidoreductase [Deltaproteobacteria bacterium]|nr:FAD-dependent oxidoreductase [Deltaproteobacteria bacterium]
MTREVLLIGGGHAHIEVIRRWAIEPPENATLTVVDPNPRPIYSGMVPGYIAGQYERADLEIDLKRLCGRAGAGFVENSVSSIDAKQHRVKLSDGTEMGYDLASIDIGSTVAGKQTPGVAEFALATRPMANFLPRVDEIVKKYLDGGEAPAPVHIVGGGAGGVEVAFCLDARMRADGIDRACVELVIGESRLLEGSAASAIAAVEKHAIARGVRIHRGARVVRLDRGSLSMDDGVKLESSAVIWVTGPAAHPLASESKLPMDARGFFRIEPTLQVEGSDDLFAVGDCASLPGMKKAGVYAVRAGPLIDANIRARLSDSSLRKYKPQRGFLSLLNLGNGEAIGTKWGITLKGVRVMWLKDRIDRSFMEKY